MTINPMKSDIYGNKWAATK